MVVGDAFHNRNGGSMKITVSDDFLPHLSNIEIQDICKDWAFARKNGHENLLQHRFTGLGHIEKSLKHDEDAEVYWFLAKVLEA